MKHLKSQLTLENLQKALVAAGYRPNQVFHGRRPFVGLVESPSGNIVGGRYFPQQNAILIYHTNDSEVNRASIEHEMAHADMRMEKRSYRGDHDKEYYARLERRYRNSGISLRAARIVESKYTPKNWSW